MTKRNVVKAGAFWEIASDNSREVEKWPEWKRAIKITSANASTGEFIAPDKSAENKRALKS